MKIYIAGKITGLKNYKELFEEAEKELNKQGHLTMNPAILPEGFPWDIYMPICYEMIDACDTVAMLPNWKESKGANMEKEYALKEGKRVVFLKE